MLGRIVSNWLTSTDERGFQYVFAQLLTLQGHRVIHISKHGPTEFGKDLLTIDAHGVPHAYQLKVGDIDLHRWRTEVRHEVEELLDLPPEHPALPSRKSGNHEGFLVTTGKLAETVRLQIGEMNRARRRKRRPPLHVLVGGQIEADLLSLHGELPAWEAKDYQGLLSFFLGTGRDPLSKEQFSDFLESLLLRPKLPPSKGRRRAMIARAVVLVGYALSASRREANHVAIAEGWVLLAGTILALAERSDLGVDVWKQSISLAVSAAQEALSRLEEEALGSDAFFGNGLTDGLVRGARLTTMLGWVSANRLSLLLGDDREWRRQEIPELTRRLQNGALLWGESAVPSWVLAAQCARAHADGTQDLGCVRSLLRTLVAHHGHGKPGLPSPYYTAEDVLRNAYGAQLGPYYGSIVCREPIDEDFNRHSFTLWTVVLLAARRGLRQTIKQSWPSLTEVLREEILVEPCWQWFRWRADGKQMSSFPADTQSWSALVREAEEASLGGDLPKRLGEIPALLPLLVAAYPHRFRPSLILHLDSAVDSAIDRQVRVAMA